MKIWLLGSCLFELTACAAHNVNTSKAVTSASSQAANENRTQANVSDNPASASVIFSEESRDATIDQGPGDQVDCNARWMAFVKDHPVGLFTSYEVQRNWDIQEFAHDFMTVVESSDAEVVAEGHDEWFRGPEDSTPEISPDYKSVNTKVNYIKWCEYKGHRIIDEVRDEEHTVPAGLYDAHYVSDGVPYGDIQEHFWTIKNHPGLILESYYVDDVPRFTINQVLLEVRWP